jgi:hypothetical protein
MQAYHITFIIFDLAVGHISQKSIIIFFRYVQNNVPVVDFRLGHLVS